MWPIQLAFHLLPPLLGQYDVQNDRNISTHFNEHLQALHSINHGYSVFKHLKINTHDSITEIP